MEARQIVGFRPLKYQIAIKQKINLDIIQGIENIESQFCLHIKTTTLTPKRKTAQYRPTVRKVLIEGMAFQLPY